VIAVGALSGGVALSTLNGSSKNQSGQVITYNDLPPSAEDAAAEAERPIGFLRQTYRFYIALQRCHALQDYYGPLINDDDVARSKEATHRAEQRLVPKLESGITKDNVWNQAVVMPPLEGGISRYWCAVVLSGLLQTYSVPPSIQRP
jgi:hypothetical protein